MKRKQRRPVGRRYIAAIVVLGLVALVMGCEEFFLGPLLDGDSGEPLAISPESTVVAVASTVVFVASGGYPPYSFAVDSGDGSIDAAGVFTAPATDGISVIAVTDLVGATRTATVTITVPTTSDIDYRVISVSHTTGETAGQAVSGEFEITNAGDDPGTHTIGWQVFASTDSEIDLGTDQIVDQGSQDALDAGESSGSIAFSGYWPSDADTYHLIVLLSTAPDDPLSSNNYLADSGTVVAAPAALDLDYSIAIITPPAASVMGGEAVDAEFVIANLVGPDTGSSQVSWNAYISDDTSVDPGADDLIASGWADPPAAGFSTETQTVETGYWPTVGSDTTWYLVIEVSAADEPAGNLSNNTSWAATTVQRPDVDYTILDVSNNQTPVETGSTINEQFTIENTGTHDGTETVIWEARVSDDRFFDADDLPASSGSTDPLGVGDGPSVIPITGTWPADSGVYYLVVNITASDDVEPTNDQKASGATQVNSPSVDYIVSSVTRTFQSVTAETGIAETFVYMNAGNTSGTNPVSYKVYVSDDDQLNVGTDDEIANVNLGAGSELGAQAISAATPVNATWPSDPDEYYLIIDVDASDNSNQDNDWKAAGPFQVTAPPDYSVTLESFPVADYGGNPNELITDASSSHGGSPLHQIRITENTPNTGLMPVTWSIYLSTDEILDGTDEVVVTDTISALEAATDPAIDLSFVLPPTTGGWYYIAAVSAGDDADQFNNSSDPAEVGVWNPTGNAETDTDEDDSYLGAADDFGITLNPGESATIDGLIDVETYYDLFVIRTGPSTTSLEIRATWTSNPSADNLDLILYDFDAIEVESSESFGLNEEPESGAYWIITGLTPLSRYYLAAMSYAAVADEGDPYVLEVIGAAP